MKNAGPRGAGVPGWSVGIDQSSSPSSVVVQELELEFELEFELLFELEFEFELELELLLELEFEFELLFEFEPPSSSSWKIFFRNRLMPSSALAGAANERGCDEGNGGGLGKLFHRRSFLARSSRL